ncbi:hypothetical protein ACINK0_05860 [Deinococcus sp. VB343]|uniref:N-acetyltransferase domain-containing protein n=1 Tax=Deinococcus sp. VB142 TaxID=3112952 RepID=A0AAU6PZ93_9DEIO
MRAVRPDDGPALAALMLAAYAGTTDDAGGTLSDAEAEVARLFAGEYGCLLPDLSRVAVRGGRLVSAALLTRFGPQRGHLPASGRHGGQRTRAGALPWAGIQAARLTPMRQNIGRDPTQAASKSGALP